jgi:hypothetical protein
MPPPSFLSVVLEDILRFCDTSNCVCMKARRCRLGGVLWGGAQVGKESSIRVWSPGLFTNQVATYCLRCSCTIPQGNLGLWEILHLSFRVRRPCNLTYTRGRTAWSAPCLPNIRESEQHAGATCHLSPSSCRRPS